MREDENDIKKRLQNYREDPDVGVWDKISVGLTGVDHGLKDQLSNYVESPDGEVWNSVFQKVTVQQQFKTYLAINRVAAYLSLLILLISVSLGILPFSGQSLRSDNNPTTARQDSLVTQKEPLLSIKDEKGSVSLSDNDIRKNESDGSASNTKTPSSVVASPLHQADNMISDNKDTSVETRPTKPGGNGKQKNTSLSEQPVSNNDISSVVEMQSSALENENPSKRSAPDSIPTKSDSIEEAKKGTSTDSTTEKKVKKSRKGSGIYFLVMPTFGYQQLDPVKNDNVFVESLQKISAFSLNRLGIRAELGWEKKISERFALSVGVLYYQRKQTLTYEYFDGRSTISTVEGLRLTFQAQPQLHTATFEYELKNIGILTGINYHVSTNKLEHRIGLSAELHKGFSKADQALPVANSLYLFGNAYYRLSYPLSKRFDAMAQSTFNYSLKVADAVNAPFYVKPYGIGISLGVYYKINRID